MAGDSLFSGVGMLKSFGNDSPSTTGSVSSMGGVQTQEQDWFGSFSKLFSSAAGSANGVSTLDDPQNKEGTDWFGNISQTFANAGAAVGKAKQETPYGMPIGMASQIGGAIGGWFAIIGAVLDLNKSGIAEERAEDEAHKQAGLFWMEARKELEQIKKTQVQERSAVNAQMGASGATLRSGSLMAYRTEMESQQQKSYDRAFQEMMAMYKQIKESAGSGGRYN